MRFLILILNITFLSIPFNLNSNRFYDDNDFDYQYDNDYYDDQICYDRFGNQIDCLNIEYDRPERYNREIVEYIPENYPANIVGGAVDTGFRTAGRALEGAAHAVGHILSF